ncbi:unnamed protein product [Diamesa hyperborea]
MKHIIISISIFLAIFKSASAIECYICNATDTSSPFQCGEWFDRYDIPDIKPISCDSVHGAKYCIKHTGRFEGGIGAIRYCSSNDLGNYCDYVQNKGDKMEYRSCVYTCDTDGCNHSSTITASMSFVALLATITMLIRQY